MSLSLFPSVGPPNPETKMPKSKHRKLKYRSHNAEDLSPPRKRGRKHKKTIVAKARETPISKRLRSGITKENGENNVDNVI